MPRSTILTKVHGLATIPGPHNSRLYDADEVMKAIYLGRDYFIWIEDEDEEKLAFSKKDSEDLLKSMEQAQSRPPEDVQAAQR